MSTNRTSIMASTPNRFTAASKTRWGIRVSWGTRSTQVLTLTLILTLNLTLTLTFTDALVTTRNHNMRGALLETYNTLTLTLLRSMIHPTDATDRVLEPTCYAFLTDAIST